MIRNFVPNFKPSVNGLKFTNSFPHEPDHQASPADKNPPPDGSTLFNYIVGRLFDSFNLPGGVTKYYE